MNKIFFILCLLSPIVAVAADNAAQSGDSYTRYFNGTKGCFLLYNMKTGTFEKELGGEHCKERVVPCSTFKVALAVMAFDAGVLKDEKEMIAWDGKVNERPELNADQNARTWMKYSVVWFSQRLTPKIGEKKIRQYLKDFRYGNEDMSGGLTEAWLVDPGFNGPALKISPYEQVDFMNNLWSDRLPVSKRAMQITRDLTYLETSANGFKMHGKTGSNLYNKDTSHRLGWFIAHITDGVKEYIVVTNFSDMDPADEKSYGGVKAKEITKAILGDAGLWTTAVTTDADPKR